MTSHAHAPMSHVYNRQNEEKKAKKNYTRQQKPRQQQQQYKIAHTRKQFKTQRVEKKLTQSNVIWQNVIDLHACLRASQPASQRVCVCQVK